MDRTYTEKIYAFKEKPLQEKIKMIAPYLLAALMCSRLAELYRLCGNDLMRTVNNMSYLYRTCPSFEASDLLIGVPAGMSIIWYVRFQNRMHRKNTRQGEEYGASRWGTAEDIKPFIDPDPSNNIILSKTEFLSMNPRMKKFSLNRNKHIVVYGSSGSGKTYSIVKPNMYQLHSSYVITDPKG